MKENQESMTDRQTDRRTPSHRYMDWPKCYALFDTLHLTTFASLTPFVKNNLISCNMIKICDLENTIVNEIYHPILCIFVIVEQVILNKSNLLLKIQKQNT